MNLKEYSKDILFIGSLVGIDQIIKIIVDNTLSLNQSINVLAPLYITKIYNYGVSFSLLSNRTYLIIAITLIAIIYLFILKRGYTNRWINIGLNLVIAGGVGNLIDRIVYNYVIDYIQVDIFNFPIFNFADILVTLGFILIIISYICTNTKETENGNKNTN